MQRITKVLIGVVAFGVLLGTLTAAGVLWLFRSVGPALRDSAKTVHSQGTRDGAGLNDSACVAASLDRLRAGTANVFRENLWLTGCLETSRLDDDLCRAVPPASATLQVSLWAAGRCNALGIGGHECGTFMQRVAEYCSSPERQKKEARRGGGV